MKVSQLKKNPNNPRQIKGEKLTLLKRSVTEFEKMMALRPIIVDENNVVLGGNMRLAAIKSLGMKEIPDEWVKRADDLTEDEKKRFIISDNAGFGEWDWDVIANEWTDYPLSDWGLDVPGFEAVDETDFEAEEAAASETINRAAQLKASWGVESGQIWQIGRHRLLVGDCLDTVLMNGLMDGKTADLLNTDPPYGISIVSVKNKGAAGQVGGSKPFGATSGALPQGTTGFDARCTVPVQRGAKSKNQIIQSNIYPVIEGDDKPFEPEFCLNLAPIIVLWGGNYFADKLPPSSGWIVWDKRENITRNTFADCEMAWSNQDKTAKIFYHLWNGLHKGSQHGERRTHPTEKPIALFAEIGKKYADKGLWLDLYAGSGAQIIAAEKCGATCYASEIEPLYCAVILERMATAFPELEIRRVEAEQFKKVA